MGAEHFRFRIIFFKKEQRLFQRCSVGIIWERRHRDHSPIQIDTSLETRIELAGTSRELRSRGMTHGRNVVHIQPSRKRGGAGAAVVERGQLVHDEAHVRRTFGDGCPGRSHHALHALFGSEAWNGRVVMLGDNRSVGKNHRAGSVGVFDCRH